MEKNRIMLDTSAYSAYLKGNQGIKTSVQHADEIFVNPVVIGELLAGFMIGGSERKNRALLRQFMASPRVMVVEIDDETSERYAIILSYLRKEGKPIPANDLWIAANAMQHGLKVLTTDNHYLLVPHIITDLHQAI